MCCLSFGDCGVLRYVLFVACCSLCLVCWLLRRSRCSFHVACCVLFVLFVFIRCFVVGVDSRFGLLLNCLACRVCACLVAVCCLVVVCWLSLVARSWLLVVCRLIVVIGCRSLFVVRCSLFVVRCALCVVRCSLFVVCWCLFCSLCVVCRSWLLVMGCWLLVVVPLLDVASVLAVFDWCWLCVVCDLLFILCCLFHDVRCLWPFCLLLLRG